EVEASSTAVAFKFPTAVTPGVDGDATVAAVASTLTVDPGGASELKLTGGYRGAEDVGSWGDQVKVQIVPNAEDLTGARFDLLVRYKDRLVETWTSLSMEKSSARFVDAVLNDAFTGSKYLLAQGVGLSRPSQATWAALSQGNDGAFDPAQEAQAF